MYHDSDSSNVKFKLVAIAANKERIGRSVSLEEAHVLTLIGAAHRPA